MANEAPIKMRRKDILPEYHEQIMLNETSRVQEQNIFNKQVEELASNLCYNYDALKQAQYLVAELSKSMASDNFFKKGKVAATASDETALAKCPGLIPLTKNGVKSDTFTIEYKIAAPADMIIGGSFQQQSLKKSSKAAIDVILVLPESILPEDPIVNYRYIFRRASYLSCVARALENQKLVSDLRVEYLNFNVIKPILNFKLGDCPLRINLIPAFAGFDANRLGIQRNLRPELFTKDYDAKAIKKTPRNPYQWYNQTLLEEIKIVNDELSVFEQTTSDALCIFKHWISVKMMSNFITGTVAYKIFSLAIESGDINETSTHVNIFRSVINFVASKLEREQLICEGFDYLFNAPQNTFETLKMHAQTSYNALHINSPAIVKYMDVFHKVNPATLSDMLVHFSTYKRDLDFENTHIIPSWMVDIKQVINNLEGAFNQRYSNLVFFIQHKAGHKVSQEASSEFDTSVSITLQHAAFNPVTIGPSTEGDCSDFLALWPEGIPQQRKFKDGRIIWTIVWNKAGQFSQNTPFKIIKSIFSHNFQSCSTPSAIDKSFKQLNRDDKAVSEALIKLTKSLYDLPDLPLSIISTRAVSPSYAGVSPTYLTEEGMYVDAVDVIVELIPSRQWPEEEDFAAALKTLVIGKIASALHTTHKFDTAARPYCLDVVVDKITFRLWVVDRVAPQSVYAQMSSLYGEIRSLSQKNIAFAHGSQICKTWLNAHLFSNQPLSASLLDTMQTLKDYSSVSHDASFFNSEFVDIVVASLFSCPTPYANAPLTTSGVLCRFLERIVTWPWDFAPLLYNLDITPEKKAQMMNNYDIARKECCACVAINYSDIQNLYTQRMPKEILDEIIRYAEFCLLNFTKGPKAIMKTPLNVYDCVVYLNENNQVHKADYVPVEFEGKIVESDDIIDLYDVPSDMAMNRLPYKFVNHHVIRDIIGLLNDNYGHLASFHADLYSGTIIGVKIFDYVKTPIKSTAESMFRNKEGEFLIEELVQGIKFICNQLLSEKAIKIKQE